MYLNPEFHKILPTAFGVIAILGFSLEFVTGGVELLKAVLHDYAGGLIFMK